MISRRSLNKLLTLSAKVLIIAVLFFSGAYGIELLNNLHLTAHGIVASVNADAPINVWWPTDGAKVSDTQAFKAVVQDKDASDYDMFWSVDGGQQNKMYDSSTDYPHKEAMVDLKPWTWKGSGPYAVTFTAVDHSGASLGSATVNISTPDAAQNPTTVQSGVTQVVSTIAGVNVASAADIAPVQPASQTQVSIQPISVSVSTSTSESTVQPIIPQPTLSAPAAPAIQVIQTPQLSPVNVWWPTQGASMQGVQPFKAMVSGMSISDYKMYWQVDAGTLHEMSDTSTDYPHKEDSVDLSSWNWKGSGPYTVTFIAQGQNGATFAKTDITITNTGVSSQPQSNVNSAPQNQTVVQQPFQVVTQHVPQITNSGDPFSGEKLYLDATNDAEKLANSERLSNPDEATQLDKIGNTPTAIWLGDWNLDVGSSVKQVLSSAQSQGSMPTFVVYDIPGRDCSQYSAGGANGADAYRSWINSIASALGNSKAAFVVEPDGISLTDCLSANQLSERFSLMQYAVATLKSKPNAHVYIDAGHPNWLSADNVASRLNKAGISQADGFSLNSSNFYTTQSNIDYGSQISNKVGGKHFIIDTGRNGNGPTSDSQWCNPPGRALGSKPTANTGNALVDAFLWLKGPGGSDGNCNGGPSAGQFWPAYAIDMARRSAN